MPHHFKGVGLHFKGVGIHFNGIPRHFKGVGLRFKGVAIHFKGHTLRFVLFAAPYLRRSAWRAKSPNSNGLLLQIAITGRPLARVVQSQCKTECLRIFYADFCLVFSIFLDELSCTSEVAVRSWAFACDAIPTK